MDVEGNNLTESELMANAFLNNGQVGDTHEVGEHYSYRRGSTFINEYARCKPGSAERFEGNTKDANHLLGCYQTLFPYGKGAFEVERPIEVSYEKHIKWALSYHDKRWVCRFQ